MLRHSEAVGALVEDDVQVAKIEPLGLPHLLTLQDLDGLRADGIAFAQAHPGALDQAAAAVGEDDLYTYIYTSGTTGPPKGCMIRHRNYYAMTSSIEGIEDLGLGEDVMLLYLPLAHNFGRLMTLWGAYSGFTIAFCSDPHAVADALPQVRPTLLPSVPRMYEKAHTTITSKLEAASRTPALARRLGAWRRAPRQRPAPAGEPLPRALRAPASDRRPARLLEGEAAVRRPPADRDLGWSAARQGDRGVLPRTRHADPRGLGSDRDARPRLPSTGPGASASARSARRCRAPK